MLSRLLLATALGLSLTVQAAASPVEIAVDATRARHPISPLIYGVAFAETDELRDMGATLNRAGGDSASLYNWRIEARQAGRDWFFESMAIPAGDRWQYGAALVARTRAAGATPVLTVPIGGWVARLAQDGGRLAAYPTDRYALQQARDLSGMPQAGNGFDLAGRALPASDPRAVARIDRPADQAAFVSAITARFGRQAVPIYLMDNEPSRWHDIHREVRGIGLHAAELAQRVIDYARAVKSADPAAKVAAPEEWGWGGFRYSGFDQQIGDAHGYGGRLPDHDGIQHGLDQVPWLLTQWKAAGHPVDILSLHYYPQGGEYADKGDDVSPAMQLRRNRSTRALWDRTYVDESWIRQPVMLIPRMRDWVDHYYWPGTPLGITEYSWGAEHHMNGATTQADILGIFGREGLYMAARWVSPQRGSPVYLAFKLYRNYDDHGGRFGETSVAADAPRPDEVSAFAALRHADRALTVVAINKQLSSPADVTFALAHFGPAGRVEAMRLAGGVLSPIPFARYQAGHIAARLPAQSITLFVVHPDAS